MKATEHSLVELVTETVKTAGLEAKYELDDGIVTVRILRRVPPREVPGPNGTAVIQPERLVQLSSVIIPRTAIGEDFETVRGPLHAQTLEALRAGMKEPVNRGL